MKWIPIESAPRDGRTLLVAWETNHGWGQAVVWWKPEFEWVQGFSKEPSKEGEYPGSYRGAWVDGGLDGSECEIEYHPSHWMPLPNPPKRPTGRKP